MGRYSAWIFLAALSACGQQRVSVDAEAPVRKETPTDLWTSTLQVSGLTDEETALVTLKSARYASSYGSTQATLQLQCRSGSPTVAWTFNETMTIALSMEAATYGKTVVEPGTYTMVKFRLDREEAETVFAIISANGTTLRLADMGMTTVDGFIKRLEGAKTLFVGVSPYRESDREVFFPVESLSAHLGDFRRLCPEVKT